MELPSIPPAGVITIKVIPGSLSDEFSGIMADGKWKIRINAEARGGKANERLLTFLEKQTGRSVKILRGRTSTRKIILFS